MVIVSAVHNFIITRNAVSISTHAAWAHVNTLLSRRVSLGEAGSVATPTHHRLPRPSSPLLAAGSYFSQPAPKLPG